MVVEKSGLIRVYSIEQLQPFYTMLSVHNRINSLPILYADWCQINPAIIIASTHADIFVWNTSNSWYDYYFICLIYYPIQMTLYYSIPDKLIQDIDNVKCMKLANYKENIIGYVSGNDISSKLKIFNYKTNQVTVNLELDNAQFRTHKN